MMKRGRPRKSRPHTSRETPLQKQSQTCFLLALVLPVCFFFSYSSSKRLYARLLAFRLQRSATKCTFLHQREEHRHKNQHVNGGGDHPSDEGRSDGFHHIGA